MKISINPVLDLATMAWLPCRSYEYCGPVMLMKGDDTAKAAEASQSTFNNALREIFTQQYGAQKQIINYLTGKMQPIINANGQGYGYSPASLVAQRTSATDTIANQFAGAQKGLNGMAVRTGGSELPSGVSAMIEGGLSGQQAEATSQALNSITKSNADLEQANYWNAINVLNGQSAALNPLAYAENSTAGTNAVSNASQAVTAANGPGVGQIIGGIVGGGLSAAANVFGGGFAKGGAFAPKG